MDRSKSNHVEYAGKKRGSHLWQGGFFFYQLTQAVDVRVVLQERVLKIAHFAMLDRAVKHVFLVPLFILERSLKPVIDATPDTALYRPAGTSTNPGSKVPYLGQTELYNLFSLPTAHKDLISDVEPRLLSTHAEHADLAIDEVLLVSACDVLLDAAGLLTVAHTRKVPNGLLVHANTVVLNHQSHLRFYMVRWSELA